MNIVIPDKINISEKYKDAIRELGGQVFDDRPNIDELRSRIKDAELITASYVEITPEIINVSPKLRYIVVPAVGYDWIDVDYAASKGITTLNCPTFNSQAVAEYAISLLLAVNRNLITAVDELRAGKWESQDLMGYELADKKLGLIGHGNIGTRIEKITRALGLSVAYVNSKSNPEEIDSLLSASDFIIVCAPLTDKTRHLIDERRLNLLKSTAVIVNVARGAIIDQKALIETLGSKKIRGAGLDVFDGEPLTGVPNNEIVEIARLPNVIATPHTAYNTEAIREKQGAELLAAIKSCIAGDPINVIKQASVQIKNYTTDV